MCFTPIISLTTAIIEFVLAATLIIFFKKTTLRNFFVLFIILLGFYQLTEYFICTTNNITFWALLAFITYNYLPAIGLHAVSKLIKKRIHLIIIYAIPVAATIVAIFTPNFIQSATCDRFFITIEILYVVGTRSIDYFLHYSYLFVYYVGFILWAIALSYINYRKQKNKIKREIEIVEILGVLLMSIPVLILILIVPALNLSFPSLLCQFAILVAIAAFIGAGLENNLPKNQG